MRTRTSILLALFVTMAALPATAVAALLSDHDKRAYAAAFEAAERGYWPQATRLSRLATEKLPAKILQWMNLTRIETDASFEAISSFVRENPDWPGRALLERRAEEAMTDSTPARAMVEWFAEHPPRTADGKMHLGAALLATGQEEQAKKVLREAWINESFGSSQERTFLLRYRKLLGPEDHVARLDRLLWDGDTGRASRLLRHVDKKHEALAIARIRLRRMQPGVDSAIAQVPDELRSDPGLLYDRARWRRLKGREDEALEVLKGAPKELFRPDLWWIEKSAVARKVLAKGYITDAYRLTLNHGLEPGTANYADAEFLGGWIATRFLNDHEIALRHFERLYESVSYPISLARGAYWAGRAAKAMGDETLAAEWFRKAAQHDATYYGQLAASQAGHASATLAPDPKPTEAEAAAFERHELVRAVRLLHEIGRSDLIPPFIDRLTRMRDDPPHLVLAGRLAVSSGRPDLGVQVARHAYRNGELLPALGYPVLKIANAPPERALLLSVARQESNFRVDAISYAGARGIMQLMPATAKSVARKLKVTYSRSRLTTDPGYNVQLGRSFLASLIDGYNGSYVLALAAYNAGPNAVNRWIRANGDPRRADTDMIDWIEMIPYGQTRNYVQRVLENLLVYRLRLGEAQVASSIDSDLAR